MRTNAPSYSWAFSLPELLAVLAILAVLMGLVVPALNQSLKASRMTTAGQAVMDELNLARQNAVSRNSIVEVRFYKLPEHGKPIAAPRTVYRGLQSFFTKEDGTAIPLGNPLFFPAPVIISSGSSASALLASPALPEKSGESAPPIGEIGNAYDYRSIHFASNGSAAISTSENHFTLVLQDDKKLEDGANYFTIQINPITGMVRRFRP